MHKYIIPPSLLLFSALFMITYQALAIDIDQASIPFAITAPGQYNVVEELTYGGAGNAITISSNQVALNLNSFSITLSKNKAVGIRATQVSDLSISNGAIINSKSHTKKGSGIHLSGTNNVIINNINTVNNRNGLFIKESHNVHVIDSSFFHATKCDAFAKESKRVTFDSCTFTDGNNGLKLGGDNREFTVINCAFPNSKFSNLLVQEVDGMIIENCLFTNRDDNAAKANLVQFGDAKPSQICTNVIMRNCTIVNRPESGGNTAPEGLGIYQGSGFLVDSCVIDIDNTNQDPAADLSGIHISNPGLGANGTIASNVIISNCVVQGPATDGIYPDVGTSNVLIENCLVSGASKDGIFLAGTSACTVSNNTVVNNGTNGIFLGETSVSNSIINNTVNSNGANPIISSIPPFGNGISIASDSSLNLVQGNTAFNNTTDGINDQGTNNRIFSNTAYANGSNNYVAATDTIITSIPGSATLTAANISA